MARTVLLVEDNPDERAIYTLFLSRHGYRVIPVADAERALEFARTVNPDVVVADLHLPFVSGLALMQILRGSRATELLPIVAISGDHEKLQEAAEYGCQLALAKPFDPKLLVQAVAKAAGEIPP